jgi:hypothetical protein
MTIDLEVYRGELEQMTAEACEEQYRHHAGLKRTLELARIYERHADLVAPSVARELIEMEAPVELRRFAIEAHLGDVTKQLTDRAASAESSLTVPFGEEQVPYLQVVPRLLNEPEADRRRTLFDARCEVTERELNPTLRETLELAREAVAELGIPTQLALYESLGWDPRGLGEATAGFLADTEALYVNTIEPMLGQRLGMSLAETAPCDMGRLWRAPEYDRAFPAERAVPALRETLAAMGIDLERQPNIELDVEPRPGKYPRAFCMPIRVPDRVILVTLPQGGHDDYQALFHEAGHAEHFGHTSRSLPAEQRLLGDDAVTEGWAFLLEHLVADPAWLGWQLDLGRSDEYLRFHAAQKLWYVRRYSAKLAYEIELHAGAPVEALPELYANHLTAAVGAAYPRSDHLVDLDPGFYCTCYLRAWAFEAQLRGHLREGYGNEWFRRREAGMLVRELWELGQSLRAEALLREVTGQPLSFEPLVDELRAALA